MSATSYPIVVVVFQLQLRRMLKMFLECGSSYCLEARGLLLAGTLDTVGTVTLFYTQHNNKDSVGTAAQSSWRSGQGCVSHMIADVLFIA